MAHSQSYSTFYTPQSLHSREALTYPENARTLAPDGTNLFIKADVLLINKESGGNRDARGGLGSILYQPDVPANDIRCRVQAKFRDGSHFVTSPNDNTGVYYPTNETIELCLRANGLFGEHDPLHWPQRLTQQNLHLACIPRGPSDKYKDHFLMFWFGAQIVDATRFFRLTDFGLHLGLGLISPYYAEGLGTSIKWLEDRLEKLRANGFMKDKPHRENTIAQLLRSLHYCYDQITTEPASLAEIQRLAVGVSRFWLYLNAWIDYIEEFRPLRCEMSSPGANVVGLFTEDAALARDCASNGIPVYLIQSSNNFHNQVIRDVTDAIGYWEVDLKGFHEKDTDTDWAGHTVFLGRSGNQQHLDAIDKSYMSRVPIPSSMSLPPPSTIPHFTVTVVANTPSPSLPNNVEHLPPAPALVSGSVGPIRSNKKTHNDMPRKRKQKSKKVNVIAAATVAGEIEVANLLDDGMEEGEIRLPDKPQPPPQPVTRDKLLDLIGEAAPDIIHVWKSANLDLLDCHTRPQLDLHDNHHGDNWRSRYNFPDPGMVYRAIGWRRAMYVQEWQYLSSSFVTHYTNEPQLLVCLATRGELWRAMLNLPFRLSDKWKDDHSKAKFERVYAEARKMLTTVMKCKHPAGAPPTPSSKSPPTDWVSNSEDVRRVIWELSELNFRSELLRLHHYFAPYPFLSSRHVNKKDLADHTRLLINDMAPVFFRDDATDPSSLMQFDFRHARKGLADPNWTTRLPFLQAFHRLMVPWPTPKPPHFDAVNSDPNPIQPTLWERALVQYYVQTWYDFSGRAAILPMTLKAGDVDIEYEMPSAMDLDSD